MSALDSIIQNIHADPVKGARQACQHALMTIEGSSEWSESDHDILLETFALLEALEKADLIQTQAFPPSTELSRYEVSQSIVRYLAEVEAELDQQLSAHKLESLKHKYATLFTSGFSYEFTEGDIKRVQTLINELRDMLTADCGLDQDHKRRLLLRLEGLQKELHKKISTLASFYVLVGDTGVVLEKLGNNAKPIVDRLKEIMSIGWNSQARAEQLPSSAENPTLGHDDDQPKLN